MAFEYKVVQLANPGFWTGIIAPKDVEKLINEVAREGWEFVSLTSQNGIGVRPGVMAVFRRQALQTPTS